MPHEGRISFFEKGGRRGVWRRTTPGEIAVHGYENYLTQAPSEGVAIITIQKPAIHAD
jgi:hypothetical protein